MSVKNDNPDELWKALRNAIEDRDLPSLAQLCEQHEETIKAHFVKWQSVPAEIRQDHIQRNAYAQSLVTLAKVFQSAGKPELMESLQQEEPDNPIDNLDQHLEEIKKHVNQKDYPTAIGRLQGLLTEYENWLGPEAQEGIARIQGLLGVTYAHAGELEKGILHTRIALQHCHELEDQEGIDIYTTSLEKMEQLLEEE
ncbi:MAG: hypothetical protein R3C11_13050 [Planctomycetaceae bacterium]